MFPGPRLLNRFKQNSRVGKSWQLGVVREIISELL